MKISKVLSDLAVKLGKEQSEVAAYGETFFSSLGLISVFDFISNMGDFSAPFDLKFFEQEMLDLYAGVAVIADIKDNIISFNEPEDFKLQMFSSPILRVLRHGILPELLEVDYAQSSSGKVNIKVNSPFGVDIVDIEDIEILLFPLRSNSLFLECLAQGVQYLANSADSTAASTVADTDSNEIVSESFGSAYAYTKKASSETTATTDGTSIYPSSLAKKIKVLKKNKLRYAF